LEQRVSLITLGVADLARSRAFYEALGWTTNTDPEMGVVFFQTGGMIVALWSRESLAEDSGVEDGGGWGGVTLAYNVSSPAEADAAIEEARRAGARIAREPGRDVLGRLLGVFVDPDGHPWEGRAQPALDRHRRRPNAARRHAVKRLSRAARRARPRAASRGRRRAGPCHRGSRSGAACRAGRG